MLRLRGDFFLKKTPIEANDVGVERTLWDAFIDLARTSAAEMAWRANHQAQGLPAAYDNFIACWDHQDLFFTYDDYGIHWTYQRPGMGRFRDA